MDEREFEYIIYRPVCSDQEIERILNPQTASDLLLKMRADAVVDQTRLLRYLRRLKNSNESNWTLTSYFNDSPFSKYVSTIKNKEFRYTMSIPAGFVFSDDPNGFCVKTEFGNIILLSKYLQRFMYFMNLGVLNLKIDVPTHVRIAAQRIGMRIMLLKESPDFEMDPRGRIPRKLHDAIKSRVKWQLQYVIGHEYGHHFLEHTNKGQVTQRSIYLNEQANESDHTTSQIFSYRQQFELDADIWSIENSNLREQDHQQLVRNALIWFSFLDMYESISLYICASNSSTHPAASDRFRNIYERFHKSGSVEKNEIQKYLDSIKTFKDFIVDDIATNTETYEFEGSVYLDAPNTKWRGRALIDRVDF